MPELMTPERLAAIRERIENATVGPWGVGNETTIALDVQQHGPGRFSCAAPLAEVIAEGDREDNAEETGVDVAHAQDDALFIAHARQDVEDLLGELDRLDRGMGDLYARWLQRAHDNGDYYTRMGAKYELGKAVAFDAAAEEIRLLMGDRALKAVDQ